MSKLGFKLDRFALKALFACALMFLACTAGAASEQESKGKVEQAEAGFWAVRDGKRTDLEPGADIYEFDILATDSTGAGSVRFIDGTVLELRNNTEIDVKEVAFSEARNRFNVGVVEGSARIITGAIVRQNPRGFKSTTPKSTIGISGTDYESSVQSGPDGITTTTTLNSIAPGHSLTESFDTGVSITTSKPGTQISSSQNNQVSVDGQQVTSANDPSQVDPGSSMPAGTTATDTQGTTAGDAGSGGSGSGGGSGGRGGGSGGGNESGGGGGGRGGGSSGGDCSNDNSSAPR